MNRVARMMLLTAAAGFSVACTGVIQGRDDSGSATPGGSVAGSSSMTGPDPSNSSSTAANRPSCTPIPARVVRLTPAQIQSSWANVVGPALVSDRLVPTLQPLAPKAGMFANSAGVLSMSSGFVEQAFGFARDIGQGLAGAGLDPCVAAGADRSCAQKIIGSLGERAYRRPLAEAETGELLAFYDSAAKSADGPTALGLVVRRLLLSPTTLFRSELGAAAPDGTLQLSADELASELSYLVSDGPPDSELLAAAKSGQLTTPEVARAQAERLLMAPETAVGLWRFFHDYLRLLHPARPEQVDEAQHFVESVLWGGDATFKSLLTQPTADGRAGALSLGGVLSSASNRSARGKFVREYFLCSPPINLPANVPKLEDGAAKFAAANGRQPTHRELLALHTSNPGCASCHSLIDPLGQPFEAFAADGSPRTVDVDGEPVVTASTVNGTDDMNGPVADAAELAAKLAQSPQAQRCFVKRLYSYAYGFDAGDADACFVDQLATRFIASNGNIRELVADLVAAPSFKTRSAFSK